MAPISFAPWIDSVSVYAGRKNMEIKVLGNMGEKVWRKYGRNVFAGVSVEDGATSYNGFVSTLHRCVPLSTRYTKT